MESSRLRRRIFAGFGDGGFESRLTSGLYRRGIEHAEVAGGFEILVEGAGGEFLSGEVSSAV